MIPLGPLLRFAPARLGSRAALAVCTAVLLLLAACSGNQVINSVTSEKGLDVARNVIYDQTHNLRLDIYAPTGAKFAPVVVFFYGGRWRESNKEEYLFVGQALASKGYITVIPNVRPYPMVRFPDYVNDGALAVKWTRDNIAQYGGSAERLFLMGHSSGAQTASLLTLTDKYLKTAGGSRSWIRGMIGLAGAYDFLPITDPELRDLFGPASNFAASQPISYVDGRNPPLLLIHGEDDEIVAARNSHRLEETIIKSGGSVTSVYYPKLSNRMALYSMAPGIRSRTDILEHIDDFMHSYMDVPYGGRSKSEEPAIIATPLTP